MSMDIPIGLSTWPEWWPNHCSLQRESSHDVFMMKNAWNRDFGFPQFRVILFCSLISVCKNTKHAVYVSTLRSSTYI